MDSAQPISLPSAFPPGMRCQARHLPLIMMLMPVDELASEKAARSSTSDRPTIHRGRGGWERLDFHHLRSSVVWMGGVCLAKGLSPYKPSMASSLVRYARPETMTEEAWSSLPYSPCTSCRLCFGDCSQTAMAARYLSTFLRGSETVQLAKSQSNPMKGVTVLNRMSFNSSHGVPRG